MDNRENCEVLPDPPAVNKPRNAVGDTPKTTIKCGLCERIWWCWNIRDSFSRLGQRWYVIPKPKESSDGIHEHQNLDG